MMLKFIYRTRVLVLIPKHHLLVLIINTSISYIRKRCAYLYVHCNKLHARSILQPCVN
jgi:hypothetical protein